ncbi:MAG TPA: DEAD/DEAH box helicase, partial [Clostridia bacterium]|nr:DEAD/DEAH box helicase [Clostridia bacterium]
LNLEGQELDGMSNLMDHLGIDYKDLSGETIEIPKYRALFLDEQLRDTGIKSIRRNSAFKDLVSNIKEPGDLDLLPPPSLKNILRNYQDFGFKWMKSLASYGMGGILADDMGLGKTLQVIALLLSDKKEKGQKPSLVIVPTSLVYNWEDEVEKFAPELSTLVLSGTKEERMEKLKDIGDKDMVITSYPLIRRDGENLSQHSFRYCILDEAQNIKNPDSQGAKMVKIMDAEGRFALTGTPMENTLSELWSIFDFIMPGYLFSHGRFKKQFESPIVKDEDKKASQRLSYHIKPFILRRLKRDVLKELPDKIEHKVSAELTLEQKKVYLAYMQEIRAEIEKEIDDKGFNRSHIKILAGLTRLRQICCHPSTFLENYKGGSGKLQLLEDIIDEALQGGHRILLFSQFTSMLAIIKESLKSKGIKYQYLDGSTPMEERGQLVRAFNGGEGEIFLISLKAGGTGLNLTGADTVIHFDPWWNPAVEDQATDRAHRIGQEKVVHVMKLITRGTIEEKIFALQQKKKELIDAVIEPGHSLLSKMTEEELRGLFAL